MAVVIKIGGSLFRDAGALVRVCNAVARVRGRIVVIAGGGVLADRVRDMQSRNGIDDPSAHVMAMKAMDTNGLALVGQFERGVAVKDLDDFGAIWSRDEIPIWLPCSGCEGDDKLTPDWSTTSDAIAARLCERLGGGAVVLLKSCAVDPGMDIDALVKDAIVDPEFPKIVKRAALSWRVLGPMGDEALAQVVTELAKTRRGVSGVVGAGL